MKDTKDLNEDVKVKSEAGDEVEKMAEIEIEDLAIDGICGVY